MYSLTSGLWRFAAGSGWSCNSPFRPKINQSPYRHMKFETIKFCRSNTSIAEILMRIPGIWSSATDLQQHCVSGSFLLLAQIKHTIVVTVSNTAPPKAYPTIIPIAVLAEATLEISNAVQLVARVTFVYLPFAHCWQVET